MVRVNRHKALYIPQSRVASPIRGVCGADWELSVWYYYAYPTLVESCRMVAGVRDNARGIT
jgi:hypothetical protein